MILKPHIKLNTKVQFEKPIKLSFNYGKPEEPEVDYDEEKDYTKMAVSFRLFLENFQDAKVSREAQRNLDLNVPEHIDYLKIIFHAQFDVSKYFQQWYNEFGLIALTFENYNQELLFGVIEPRKFADFLNQIESFIKKESGDNPNTKYSEKLKYMKSFELLTSEKISNYDEVEELMNFRLIDFPLNNKAAIEIYQSLKRYLHENNIAYRFQNSSSKFEVLGLKQEQLVEIINNYDIVLSVTSALSTVVRPTSFNLPERTYGFDVTDGGLDLPIIGILDTGISSLTPLVPIIIDDETFNLTTSHAFLDEANDGSGHGTAVAALAALGKDAYSNKYTGTIRANARVLSMKIMDNNSASISEASVLELLNKAKSNYPQIKVFVLTICYNKSKKSNELPSTYAYELDKFAHENDCLITICTANNDQAANNSDYALGYFNDAATYLCPPSESMNNLTVGAAAGCLSDGAFLGISPGKEFPALYSRRSHINLEEWYSVNKINKAHFKPDVIEFGGDYEMHKSGAFFGQGLLASMELLSANPTESFWKHIGTSFSTPLVANTAVRIQSHYSEIKAQSIKALIVNSASLTNIPFGKQLNKLTNKVAGHGLSNSERSIYSNPNSISFLIEDEIEPEKLAIFPINFPKYLTENDLKKKQGILKITATLCFSFEPVLNSQLAYCPVHIAFCFFKNHTANEIQTRQEDVDSLLRSNLRWSQSGRYVTKPIPNTNTQKLSFHIGVDDLLSEASTLKLAVNCRINSQLLPGQEAIYNTAHPFSIAITFDELLPEKRLTGRLYDEMILCNEVEAIGTIEQSGEAISEATS